MAGFYCSISVPDKAVLTANAPDKPGLNSIEVIKDARKTKAYKLMEKGQYTQAVQEVNKLLNSNPHDVSNVFCAAMVYMKAGSKNDAFVQMKKALALAPRNKDLRLEFARMLTETGQTEDAITQYRMVIKQAPKFTGPRMDLAQLLLSIGQPGEAAKELQDLIKVNPNDVSAHKVLGIALARDGHAQEGMEEYLTGMTTETSAGQPEAVKFILGSWGNIDKAKFELEQQANRNPDDPMPKLRLAEICLYGGRPEEAKSLLLDARKLSPNNPEIHRSLCIAFKRLGDNRQALTSFMQSVALEQEQNKKLKMKVLVK